MTTLLSKGCVKSVQRGFYNGKGVAFGAHGSSINCTVITINISAINKDKAACSIISNLVDMTSGYGSYILDVELSNTELKIYSPYNTTVTKNVSWQVIEFYQGGNYGCNHQRCHRRPDGTSRI